MKNEGEDGLDDNDCKEGDMDGGKNDNKDDVDDSEDHEGEDGLDDNDSKEDNKDGGKNDNKDNVDDSEIDEGEECVGEGGYN